MLKFISRYISHSLGVDKSLKPVVMSPVAPSHLTSSEDVKLYSNCEVPICDILAGKKRKNDKEEDITETSSDEEEAVSRPVKKRLVKLKSYKDKENSDCEKDDDLDYERKSLRNGRKEILRESNEEIFSGQSPKKSSYEKMIEKKRAERIALLKSLEIDQIKDEISEAVDSIKKIKTVTRSYKKKVQSPPSVTPIRRSKRLANIDADLSENALEKLAVKNAVASAQRKIKYDGHKKTKGKIRSYIRKFQVSLDSYDEHVPSEMTFEFALKSASPYEEWINDLSVEQPKCKQEFIDYDKSVLRNMNLSEFNVYKVVPNRITSAAWYPSKEDLVVAAGDKYGNLALWKIQDSETTPHLFKVHNGNIPNMQFSFFDPVHLITASYDGSMRCGDLIKHTFNEIYESDIHRVTWFDFLSPSTFLVSHSNGEVAVIDKKTKGKRSEKRHACHDFTIKTISLHPVNKNVFVTCDNKKSIRLWDLRKLQKNPVVEILHHKRTVNSAFFSPVTGNSILSTSLDDSICIFDSTKLTEDIKLATMMTHNNFTGRWLTIFRATWLPNSDDLFSVGCMEKPRRVEIYNKDLGLYEDIISVNLTTITSVHSFHPYRSALACGNSSGRLFVFT